MDASSCRGPIIGGPITLTASMVTFGNQPPPPPEPVWVKHLPAPRWLPWCSIGRLSEGDTELVVSVTDMLVRVQVRGRFIEAGW